MTGLDSAVAPVSGTDSLIAAVNPRPAFSDFLHDDSLPKARILTDAGHSVSEQG